MTAKEMRAKAAKLRQRADQLELMAKLQDVIDAWVAPYRALANDPAIRRFLAAAGKKYGQSGRAS